MNPTEPLSLERALLVDVSAALARGGPAPVDLALRSALDEGVDPVAVEEVMLQGYLFLGYPRALAAFARWRKISGREASPAFEGGWEAWRERGEAVCQEVYGGQYERLRGNVRALSEELEDWMVVEGYGKVLGRPGLDLLTRELCVAALLAVLDAPAQLYSHLRGALNVGASVAEVDAMLVRVLRDSDSEGRRQAREVWKEVRGRWEELQRVRDEGRDGGTG